MLPLINFEQQGTSIVVPGQQALDSRIVFNRPSNAYDYNASGTLVQAATNEPRFDFNPVTLAPRGLLIEGARTNIALFNRDLTNAAWVKTNMAADLTQTGIDGVANSATLLTATAANATVLQTVTLASSQRATSVYIRRVTGSGVINVTTDNGTTWTVVTVTAGWTRVEIPAQTVTNPVFGIRIVTSGDAVAVDGFQNEGGAFPSSVILTTTTAATRAADVVTVSNLANINYNQSRGTFIAEFEAFGSLSGERNIVVVNDGTSANQMHLRLRGANNQVRFNITNAGSSLLADTANTYTFNAVAKTGFSYNSATGGIVCLNGGATVANARLPATTLNQMTIGINLGIENLFGWIRRLDYYPIDLTPAQLQALTV